MKLRSILMSASAIGGWMLPAAAMAQDVTEAPVGQPAEQAADAAAPVVSSDIIVTARRRDEAIQDVPISVSALSGEQLERSGVTDAASLQYHTPSLSVTSAQSQRNTVAFALRGQRTQETQLFTDPPVGTYFAEVVIPRPYGFGKTFYDLQSVQVLKGVQGTLFGRNMTGGAVLVEPAHPELGTFSGELRGQYGNYDMWDLHGAINVPLGDTIAVRVAGITHERDGWAREVTTGRRYDNQNFDSFRVSALWEPTDSIESLTVYDWYKSKEAGTASFLTSISQPSVITAYEAYRRLGLIDANIPAQFAEAQELFRQKRFTQNLGAGEGGNLDAFGEPYENIKTWGITNKTTIRLNDNLTLKNIFGYREQSRDLVQDYDGIPAFLITPNQFASTDNLSEELQLQGKVFDNKLEFIVGAYYFEEEGLDGSLANTLPERNMITAGVNARTTPATLFLTSNPGKGYARTAAGYVAGTFHATDQISISGGLRYNYDKRKITVSPSLPNIPNPDGSTGRCIFDIDATTPGTQTVPFDQCSFTNSKSFKEWTYDATLQWEPTPEITTYASYRHGFRAGGFSTRATSYVSLEPFLPEFVDEYEIGLKTNTPVFGTGRLTTSTALFLQDGSDVQKQRATFVNGNVFTVVDNTAKQRNTGGEFEATLSVPNFTLTGYYSYTKVEIKEGRAISAIGPEFDQRGTPRHQAGATATVSPPVGDAGELNLMLNYSWRSLVHLDDFEVEGDQPAFGLVNFRAELNSIAGTGASVAFFVNNALDETYRIGVLGLMAEGLGFQSSVYGEPRMYGMEVGYKF